MKATVISLLSMAAAITMLVALPEQNELAKVKGRVTDLMGNLIDQAEIQFFKLEDVRGIPNRGIPKSETLVRRVVADRQGTFNIEEMPWGQYRVDVALTGFGRTEVCRFGLWRAANRVLDIGLPLGYEHGLSQIRV